jgi:hypothetical protein
MSNDLFFPANMNNMNAPRKRYNTELVFEIIRIFLDDVYGSRARVGRILS